MQVIESIFSAPAGKPLPIHRCPRDYRGLVHFLIYDSVSGSRKLLIDTCDKIESYIKENNVFCTIGEYPVYFTMSEDAVRLYESEVIDYIYTRPISSKPKLCVTTMSNNILLEVELKKSFRVATNIYDLILNGGELVNSDGVFILSSVFSTLESVYKVKDIKRVNKLIVKRQILKNSKSKSNL